MTQEPAVASGRFPVRLLTAAVVLTALALVWLGGNCYRAYRVLERVRNREFRLEQLHGAIVHLDEVLTMSAKMGAATGEEVWERRYLKNEPRLDDAIQEALRLAPETRDLAAKTEAANTELVAMELRAFEWIRNGELATAAELLASEEYTRQKQVYARSMSSFGDELRRSATATLEQEGRRAYLHFAFVFTAMLALALAWHIALRAMRSWQAALETTNRDLAELNRELDQRVAKRTTELEASRAEAMERLREAEQARAAERASEERFRTLVETTSDWIWEVDETGTYTYASPKVGDLLGYEPGEVVGKTPFEFMPPEEARRVRAEFVSLAESRSPLSQLENTNRHRDGRLVVLETSAEPIIDASGTFRGYRGIDRDITEAKAAEEDLVRFRTLVDHSTDAFFVIHPGTGRFLDVNQQACRSLGHQRDELLDLSVPDIEAVIPDSFSWDDHVATVRRDGQMTLEGRHRRKDGSTLPVEVSVRYVARGEGDYLVAVVRDISERKQAEAQLHRTMKELERSNSELEQFAYVASHDLQEPLRAVSGCLRLLQRRYGGQLDEKADEFIDHAAGGALRMQTLINELLSYSRVGMEGGEHKPTNCSEVAEEALGNLGVAVRESGAQVDLGPLPTISADRSQLVRLFQNLIGNALKFSDEGPPRVRVAARPDNELWRFSVADNGIGIEPRLADRIFGLCQRLHGRAEYPGTGIGLAVCKKVVEGHGGRIWVESEPGVGTTFWFTLPGEPAPDRERAGPAAERPPNTLTAVT